MFGFEIVSITSPTCFPFAKGVGLIKPKIPRVYGSGFRVQNKIPDLPRGNTFEALKSFYLKAKVRIWP